MAEKVVAIKIEVEGTSDQNKKLAQLEKGLKELTDQRKALNKAVKEGTITQDQFASRISKVNTAIKATRSELNKARNSILGVSSFTEKLGTQFKKLGTQISGAFIGLFAIQKFNQLVTDTVKIVQDFEQQMAKVQAVTGATAEEFSALEKSAKDLGATTQFTATQVGKLQEEYAKLGFTTDEILDATEATLELAVATGSDLAQSATVAAATINGFGLEAEDTQKVVDVMAASFTQSALDINKFEVAMAAVAPVAQTVGMSIEETTASLGVLVDAGFDASTAGTALRNILLDTQKAGISVSEAMEQIRTSTDPASTALDLFGKRGAAVAITLAENEQKAVQFTNSLQNAAGSAAAMADVVGDTLEGDLNRLSSAWEGLVLSVSDGDIFRGLTQSATNLLNQITELTKNIHEESDALEEQRLEMNALVGVATNVNTTAEERQKVINRLQVQYPDFLKNLNTEKVTNEELSKRLKEVNNELVDKIVLQRQNEKVEEAQKVLGKARTARLEEEIRIRKELSELQKTFNLDIDTTNKTVKESIEATLDALGDQKDSAFATGTAVALLTKQLIDYDNAVEDVTDAESELNEVQVTRAEVLKLAGIQEEANTETTEENTEATNANTDAQNKNNAAIKSRGKFLSEITAENVDRFKLEEELNKNSIKSLLNRQEEITFDDFLSREINKRKVENEKETAKQIDNVLKSQGQTRQEEFELEQERIQQRNEFIINSAQQLSNTLLQIAQSRVDRQRRLQTQALEAQLEQGLINQQEFETRSEEIERKAFEDQKKVDIAQAIANGAVGITKAFAQGGIFGTIGAAIIAAQTAAQVAVISGQSFAEGGYTGDGSGSPDATGFKQAGVVHEGEYVVPKKVLDSPRGGALVNQLEAMRQSKPMPSVGIGFANGGFTSPAAASLDIDGLEDRVARAVIQSVQAIPVVNNATDTVTEAIKVQNISTEATFG